MNSSFPVFSLKFWSDGASSINSRLFVHLQAYFVSESQGAPFWMTQPNNRGQSSKEMEPTLDAFELPSPVLTQSGTVAACDRHASARD
uniref:Uncharacterized protein n=1 Tax=Peronospora matthiolae TaxID=2874970 RepID=A0AAV1V6Z6_9STRA